MKTIDAYKRMGAFFLFVFVFPGWTGQAQAFTSPTSTVIKVYEMRASLKSDCTDAVSVFKTASPTPIDLVANGSIGSGSIPDGTYHCIMFHISDMVTVVPLATDGAYTAGTPATVDIFRDAANDVSITPDGVTITAHPNMEDNPWVYFSDSAQALSTNNCFEPNTGGCACSGPCPLSPVSVTGDQTRHLVINLVNKLDGVTSGQCAFLLPSMTVR